MPALMFAGLPLDLLGSLLVALDLAAAAVFAITGALVASRNQMDIVAFMWLGVVTGIGGGTVRDLLLNALVFWVRDAAPLIVCLVASILVYFTAHLIGSRYRGAWSCHGVALVVADLSSPPRPSLRGYQLGSRIRFKSWCPQRDLNPHSVARNRF